MWLTSLSIRRPVFILMVISALLVMGINALTLMPLDRNPRVDLPFVAVVTAYPGAGPSEIESQITKKVEDAVASVSGVDTIRSTSQEGQSSVSIQFVQGTDSNAAAADVREKVAALAATMPEDALDPVVLRFDMAAEPILYYGLTGSRPSREVRDIADRVVTPRLSKVPGVAAITVTGGDVREISVGVRKARLDAYGISILQLVGLLRANNLNFPVGHIVEGNREYSVRVVGEFTSVEAIAATRLRMPNGQTVRLSDIADVRDTVAEVRRWSRVNRVDSVAIVVQKTSEANTVDTARGIKAEIAQLEKDLPGDLEFVISQDNSVHIEHDVADLQHHLVLGSFLAVAIVFLFLHSIRGTIIVALVIPTSIIATFLPMWAFGFTMNGMTLLALTLSVGVLVDDAIVVLESIYRHLALGEEPIEAAINGRSEIGLAAITITLVDVVVFVPIAFMAGIVGQFFMSFGITMACAVLFSLLMSFTLTPMLASRWYRAGETVEATRGVLGAVNAFYHFLDRLYRRILQWALRYRGVVVYTGSGLLILIMVAIAASVAGPAVARALPFLAVLFLVAGLLLNWRYRAVGLITTAAGVAGVFVAFGLGVAAGRPLLLFRFAPDQDQGQVSIVGELPTGSSLARTMPVVGQVEEIVSRHPDVENVFTAVGATAAGFGAAADVGPQYFALSLKLREKASVAERINPFADRGQRRVQADSEVAGELRAKLGQIPGVTLKVAAVTGAIGGMAPLHVDIRGADINELTALGEQVLALFKAQDGVINADISTQLGRPEQRIDVDREKAASYGLTVAAIAGALRTSIAGDDTVVFREAGEEYNVRVHFADFDRRDTDQIGNIVVGFAPAPDGSMQSVRLRDVATVSLSSGPTRIDRMDRQKSVSVTAQLAPGYATGNVQLALDESMGEIDFGANSYAWGGEARLQTEEGGYMLAALALSVILVYMLMAALFDDLLYPLVIMLSLPQALVGALLALLLWGHSLNIVSMIGIIGLMGIVTKNAILLVDYTNTLRKRGLSRTDAILEAGPTRLRPILMTTLATIGAMLPTALELGRGAAFRAPLAVTYIGGLTLSTLLTLVVIPCVYVYFDDLGRFIARRVFRRRMEGEAPGSALREPTAVE
ncbi:MAG TPA: efflux RND transporter permease subunit [Chthonomonadales bacterium]|nr:efflux RND transporter permease subunit [Chthonomonadales bacterium]